MRVKIGKYVRWIGPYQLAEMIPFISEDTSGKIGEWLADTWVNDVCIWFDRRKKRKIEVHIDKWDTWNMDDTLAHIIVPMLKQLKATKHGSPIVDDEDVPEHMRYSNPRPDEWEADNWVHYKWEWIMNEMIWAFEKVLDESWEDQFYHGESDYELVLQDDGTKLSRPKNPDFYIDMEGMKAYNDRIQNGLRLFGKYYRNLWD